MAILFKNKLYFSILFFIILIIDIVGKHYLDENPYRFMTKPLVATSLLIFYFFNNKESNKLKYYFVVSALVCFLIGDILFISGDSQISFLSAMLLFSIAKIFYSAKFSNSNDFNTNKLLPFLAISFIYMFVLFKVIYDGLNKLFIPVLFYFFVTLVMAQMIFLRKNAVCSRSYILALIGVIILLLGETITAIKTFHSVLPYQEIFNMLFYGLAQYLIVISIVIEDENPVLSETI